MSLLKSMVNQTQAAEESKEQVDEAAKTKTVSIENIGPIPGVNPDDEDYNEMVEIVKDAKKNNKALYKKMMNWD
jgi:hypothetical protein